ncbi:putative flavonoid 3'-monooxygenase [Medicago truncatula]|uniref:Putative flavonoid 3'-monooxygenase n=1 Tax=Medicago truncatula TaxID=3880 RepID=A0A396IWJ0_MEDTR|nr:putative flavonoid 3'-monooxygenase [Medicago truncatula]
MSLSSGCCSVNLSEMLIETTNKMICRCIFGRKYDDEGYRLGELGRRITSQVGLMFSLAKLKKIKDSSEEMDDFLDRVIVEHKMSRRDPKKKDFLDILLQLQDDGLTEFELTQNDLKALLMVFLSIPFSSWKKNPLINYIQISRTVIVTSTSIFFDVPMTICLCKYA